MDVEMEEITDEVICREVSENTMQWFLIKDFLIDLVTKRFEKEFVSEESKNVDKVSLKQYMEKNVNVIIKNIKIIDAKDFPSYENSRRYEYWIDAVKQRFEIKENFLANEIDMETTENLHLQNLLVLVQHSANRELLDFQRDCNKFINQFAVYLENCFKEYTIDDIIQNISIEKLLSATCPTKDFDTFKGFQQKLKKYSGYKIKSIFDQSLLRIIDEYKKCSEFSYIKDKFRVIVRKSYLYSHQLSSYFHSEDLHSYEEVILIVEKLFIIDCDIFLKGKNVIILCPKIFVKPSSYTFDVSGADGQSFNKDDNTLPTANPSYGKPGRIGKNGESSGNVYIQAKHLHNGGFLTIKANGGNGGPGENGQNGKDGVDGIDGHAVRKGEELGVVSLPDVSGLTIGFKYGFHSKKYLSIGVSDGHMSKMQYFNSFQHDLTVCCFESFWGHGLFIAGQCGTPGTAGEDGGEGAKGGKGGFKGNVVINVEDMVESPIIEAEDGFNGNKGEDGKGGKGGRNGKTGENLARYDRVDVYPDSIKYTTKYIESAHRETVDSLKEEDVGHWCSFAKKYVKYTSQVIEDTYQANGKDGTIESKEAHSPVESKKSIIVKVFESVYHEMEKQTLRKRNLLQVSSRNLSLEENDNKEDMLSVDGFLELANNMAVAILKSSILSEFVAAYLKKIIDSKEKHLTPITSTTTNTNTPLPATSTPPTTHVLPTTTAPPASTVPPGTSSPPASTVPPATTAAPASYLPPATTAPPASYLPLATTASPASTVSPATTATPASYLTPATTAIPASCLPPATTATPASYLPLATTAPPASHLLLATSAPPSSTVPPATTETQACYLPPVTTATPASHLPLATVAPPAAHKPTASTEPPASTFPPVTTAPPASHLPPATTAQPASHVPPATTAPQAPYVPLVTTAPPASHLPLAITASQASHQPATTTAPPATHVSPDTPALPIMAVKPIIRQEEPGFQTFEDIVRKYEKENNVGDHNLENFLAAKNSSTKISEEVIRTSNHDLKTRNNTNEISEEVASSTIHEIFQAKDYITWDKCAFREAASFIQINTQFILFESEENSVKIVGGHPGALFEKKNDGKFYVKKTRGTHAYHSAIDNVICKLLSQSAKPDFKVVIAKTLLKHLEITLDANQLKENNSISTSVVYTATGNNLSNPDERRSFCNRYELEREKIFLVADKLLGKADYKISSVSLVSQFVKNLSKNNHPYLKQVMELLRYAELPWHFGYILYTRPPNS